MTFPASPNVYYSQSLKALSWKHLKQNIDWVSSLSQPVTRACSKDCPSVAVDSFPRMYVGPQVVSVRKNRAHPQACCQRLSNQDATLKPSLQREAHKRWMMKTMRKNKGLIGVAPIPSFPCSITPQTQPCADYAQHRAVSSTQGARRSKMSIFRSMVELSRRRKRALGSILNHNSPKGTPLS